MNGETPRVARISGRSITPRVTESETPGVPRISVTPRVRVGIGSEAPRVPNTGGGIETSRVPRIGGGSETPRVSTGGGIETPRVPRVNGERAADDITVQASAGSSNGNNSESRSCSGNFVMLQTIHALSVTADSLYFRCFTANI